MNGNELERAWPAAEPPAGFADRVMQRLQPGTALPHPTLRRAGWPEWLTARRTRSLALAAVVLALSGLLLLWSGRPARDGDVLAAEPRVVTIGERAVGEMSSGAHIRWSGDDVQQDRGAVTYRVVPGSRFRVRTPHGNVAALGTVFRVAVADPDQAGGEPMKKRWAIAGASATLGALLFVSVDQGSVRLSRGEHELILRAGQSGSIGADGIPRSGTDARGTAVVPSEPAQPGGHDPATHRPTDRRSQVKPITPEAERLRGHVLDSLRRQQQGQASENAKSGLAAAAPVPGTMVDRTGELGERSMRVLNHEFMPLVDDCYDQARERDPQLRGMLAVEVQLAVAEELGGIIETVEPAPDRNQIDDDELIECVRQSAFSIVLPAPTKTGRTSLQLTIPLGEQAPAPARQ